MHSISAVPTSAADDQRARMRTYVTCMVIRTISFVLAVVVYAVTGSVIAAILLSIAAVILPYPAVVLANNTATRQTHAVRTMTPTRQLGGRADQDTASAKDEDRAGGVG
ncbi:Protein of unknown function [Austwickia chelonae]|uniref:DUF3099 domain-containing protein n=1 Tax=Austwickia chelonae NBRC 105200 TaxID=1184607 RepID=K6V5D7_9MICO|nr:hypothetical protein AUCHE_05_03390 [Austwickia chelonae NBRC 105200]SEW10231.1 Protein of unknown function [Austwickia chelonae]